jgi:DGQHR domain-containing protein
MNEIKEGYRSFTIPVLSVTQPIGSYFIGVVEAKRLCEITDFDIRRLLGERGFETYLGIQRPLDSSRVKEIQQFVRTVDACFPAGVILSVGANCAAYDPIAKTLQLNNYIDPDFPERNVLYRSIAKVIDGQHRIEGLKEIGNVPFDVAVSIFVDIDVAEEGYIFSTVNLAQTKVNRSLAFDLYDLAKVRSPQKFCHNVAVTLDKDPESPFYHRVKRLGVATEGRFNETITQATVVDTLMPYISKDPMKDRDSYLRGHALEKASSQQLRTLLFRNMFIEEKDLEIVDILWNYFQAARSRWPMAWNSLERGEILSKTNGFRALMRFLRPVYLSLVQKIGEVPKQEQFSRVFGRMDMTEEQFNIENYVPGTSGEAALFKALIASSGL